MADYPHLHLRGLGHASGRFRAKGRGDDPEIQPVPNRKRHARNLQNQLDEVSSHLKDLIERQKAAGVVNERRGIALTAFGRDGEEIRVGTAKLGTRGIELLSLKRVPGEADIANFFVTRNNIKSLSGFLAQYGAYQQGKKPLKFKLFETVDRFSISELEYLWTDEDTKFPRDGGDFDWEVWVRLANKDLFERSCARLAIEITGGPTEFVDTAIYNLLATPEVLEVLIEDSASVVELRSASSFAADYGEFDPEERIEMLETVLELVSPPPGDAPITTILDTGVNHANPLVGIALDASDCLAAEDHWPTNDHDGHGTKMAGMALYGDLEAKIGLSFPITLETGLESIVIAAPAGAPVAHAHDTLQTAIDLIEADGRSRVLCLAQTAPNDLSTGRQTPLSGVVDRASWNGGEDGRLICVAAGNVQGTFDRRYPVSAYENRNAEHRIESPGQAVNALTVGAATQKCHDAWELVASEGDLCPSARTSQDWHIHYAYKPDIVMEGGNQIREEEDIFSFQHNETMLLTAGRNYPNQPFSFTGETSAATAQAAGLATRLQARYPHFRAETLRGMMVHSAEWTPAMRRRLKELQKQPITKQTALFTMLRCYGWGVPNEERLFQSAGDALTLIMEDNFQPYQADEGGTLTLREMKYFKLPWPTDILLGMLNQEDVEMRCTLSYFVEPDPHAASRSRRDRYSSHGVRFAVKIPGDTDLDTQLKVNEYADEEDVEDLDSSTSLGVSEKDNGWVLGDKFRRRGTIHHDIWKGKGYQLAERDGIAIYPVRGWWGERKGAGYENNTVRFSLIVSIRTQSTDVDLMAEAMVKVRARNLTMIGAVPIPSS